MKKLILLIATPLSLFLTTACQDKKTSQSDYEDEDLYENIQRDSTIYGICSEGSAMHTLQMVTDAGDTLTLSLVAAQDAGQVFGGYALGDHMAVLSDRGRTQATMVVNLTTLLGEWVMPNPMDGSSEMGISIRDGGIAESINQTAIIYQTWRLVNGKLELMSVRDGGGDFEEVERYKFLYLTADSLAISNEEDVYEYARPKPEEDYGNIGINLDDEAEEDMQMVM